MAINISAKFRVASVLAGAIVLSACGGGDDVEAPKEAMKKAAESMTIEQEIEQGAKQLAEAFAGDGEAVPVVDHKALKDLLPEAIDGLKRTSASAAKRGAMGFNVAQASAEYRAEDGDGVLSLSIDDIGGAGAIAKLGLEMFDFEIDSEDENGFERTSDYRGYKAMEKMQQQGGHSLGEMTIFVGDRFIIRIDAQDLSFDRVREVADGIDLDSLAAMAPSGEAG